MGKSMDAARRIAPTKAQPQKTNTTPKKIVRKSAVRINVVPPITARPILYQPRVEAPIVLRAQKHFWQHQRFTIPAAIVLTFFISLATSQGIASFRSSTQTNPGNLQVESQNSTASSLAVTQPNNPTMADHVISDPTEIYLPEENIQLPDPLKQRKEFLKQYLNAKHSPLADHVDAISEQSQWKLIIAIARAESSFCKRKALNNCWGIGGAWNLKGYDNYDDAIADVNRILEQHYISAGLDSPKKIVNKWVGHPSDNWEAAVQEELDNLKDVQ